MRTSTGTAILAVAALATLTFTGNAAAGIAVKTISPAGFTLVSQPSQVDPFFKNPGVIRNSTSGGTTDTPVFYAPISLPIGARITDVIAFGIPQGGDITVVVARKRMADYAETLIYDAIPAGNSVYTTIGFNCLPGAPCVVRAGFKYYALVYVPRGTEFGGVKIVYKR